MLNLLLAPLELLTRYHISFTLRQGKPNDDSIEEQKDEDDISEDIQDYGNIILD